MMTVKRIHHINFLVRDLDQAVARYAAILGQFESLAQREELPTRGVRTARFKVGETWLILLQPTNEDGIPARHLQQHGEGFFLLSLEEDALDQVMESRGHDLVMDKAGPRRDIENWAVWDIDVSATFGAQLQFCQAD